MALVISSALMAAAETVWVARADQRKGMCPLNHSGAPGAKQQRRADWAGRGSGR